LNTKIIIGPEERDAGIKPAASHSHLNTKNKNIIMGIINCAQ